jgi:hypothetical protein
MNTTILRLTCQTTFIDLVSSRHRNPTVTQVPVAFHCYGIMHFLNTDIKFTSDIKHVVRFYLSSEVLNEPSPPTIKDQSFIKLAYLPCRLKIIIIIITIIDLSIDPFLDKIG